MAVDLSRVKDREALAATREPHWQRLRPGCFLGYRPSAREGVGTWIARAYDEESHSYGLKALGDFGSIPNKERYTTAKKEAEKFAELVESGGHAQKTAWNWPSADGWLWSGPPDEAAVTCGRLITEESL